MRMRINCKNDDKKTGYSQTRQRHLLLELIRDAGGHIDAKELFKRASAKDQSISSATVYRTLSLFKQLGMIEAKRLGRAHCYYEIKHSHQHQHLVCNRCGKVVDFDCPLNDIVEKVEREHCFKEKLRFTWKGFVRIVLKKGERSMPGKVVLVDFNKCQPDKCENGICKAAQVCQFKLLKQEKSYEIPMADPFICRGCGDCVRACPWKAIIIGKT